MFHNIFVRIFGWGFHVTLPWPRLKTLCNNPVNHSVSLQWHESPCSYLIKTHHACVYRFVWLCHKSFRSNLTIITERSYHFAKFMQYKNIFIGLHIALQVNRRNEFRLHYQLATESEVAGPLSPCLMHLLQM